MARILVLEAGVLREKYGDGKHATVMGAIESLLGRQEAVARVALAAVDAGNGAAPPAAYSTGMFGWITNRSMGSGAAKIGNPVKSILAAR